MDSGTTKILLVEDHHLLRQALAEILGRERDFLVVAQAGSLAEARGLLEGVDVAIVDPGLPDGDGTELISELREASPGCIALIMTASLDRTRFARAVEAGAAGMIHKASYLQEVIDAVRRARAEGTLLSTGQIIELMGLASSQRDRAAAARAAAERLTPQEKEILQGLGQGLGNKEIARRLGVAIDTERNYMATLLTKLGARTRLQALVIAIRHGLVDLHPKD
ncbi:response regulator transcription factor [Rubrobacter tropicus]|uniref:response regulator transcription factor n=1 Tax=Rubrobacter tropicus TaxID=2653851 RepID=UPI001D19518A|nr:response regulator transcription factor [Rubrobacter tropicus]